MYSRLYQLRKERDNVHQLENTFKTTISVNIQDYKQEIKIKRCIQVNEISQRFKTSKGSSYKETNWFVHAQIWYGQESKNQWG